MWCLRLEEFLKKHEPSLGKHYVLVTLDTRMQKTSDVIERLRGERPGSIPWMVILDGDGKRLITSDGPQGNIGYPGSPHGAQHFLHMLRTTSRLAAPELEAIRQGLTRPR